MAAPDDFGYIRVSRKMFSEADAIWNSREPFDARSARIDLFGMAAWRPRKKKLRGTVVTLQRGQLIASVRFLARRWGWNTGRCTRFINLLEELGTIEKKTVHEAAHSGTLITILNYDSYQPGPNTRADSDADTRADSGADTGVDSRRDTRADKEKEVKEGKEGKKGNEGKESVKPFDADGAVGNFLQLANRGMIDNPEIGERINPIPPSHASRQYGHDWLDAGIPVEVIDQAVYLAAKTFTPSPGNKQISSLAYFDGPVRKAWQRAQAANTPKPTAPAFTGAQATGVPSAASTDRKLQEIRSADTAQAERAARVEQWRADHPERAARIWEEISAEVRASSSLPDGLKQGATLALFRTRVAEIMDKESPPPPLRVIK